jgi:hypothetical protein
MLARRGIKNSTKHRKGQKQEEDKTKESKLIAKQDIRTAFV